MLKDILQFTAFLQQFREVERIVYYPGSDRKENDAEHSFQLALVAWYIIDKKQLQLDVGKVLKYSLVHDLVEVYAGDTLPFDTKSIWVRTKHEREQEALQKIKQWFLDVSLRQRIEAYEKRADEEARFVYALDKIIPEFNIMLDYGRARHMSNIGRWELKQHMEKSQIHPEVYALCQELFRELDAHDEWFPRT